MQKTVDNAQSVLQVKINALLDTMDSRVATVTKERRLANRYSFRQMVVAELQHQDSPALTVSLFARNLSTNGAALLMNGYVHPGSRCRLRMESVQHNYEYLDGCIRWCRFLQGRMHEVGFSFDSPIEVATYCLHSIPRRILVVDDNPMLSQLIALHLKRLNAEVAFAKDGEEGVKMALNQHFDCVLMDIEMPKLDGCAALKCLRDSGYSGQIVASTGLAGGPMEAKVKAAGFERVLGKPLSFEDIRKLIESLTDEPLISTLVADVSMHALINGFVDDLTQKCAALEKLLSEKQMQPLEKLVRELKSGGASVGFSPISDLAKKVETLLQGQATFETIQRGVRDLANLCRQARHVSN